MLDIELIRNKTQAVDTALGRRGLPPLATDMLALDQERRAAINQVQLLQQQRNELSKAVGELKKNGDNADDLMTQVSLLKDKMTFAEQQENDASLKLDSILHITPNTPQDDVPDGDDERGNVELIKNGTPNDFSFPVKDHVDLGEALGLMDFSLAASLSGARFVVLKGGLAKLERALSQFMLDIHTNEFGYTEMSPPLLAHDKAMFGVGQLPKLAEDMFVTNTGHWLIPTAEAVLTNFVADTIVDEKTLPIRMTASTPCFRSEAGSAGRDTRGMIRQHQFYKVELVSITTPEQSAAEHERMTIAAETILQKLELPYRKMLLCAGDMGFCSQKTYDLEVWIPSQNMYREISSCSNCGAFQARRMKARYRPEGNKKTEYVHTLNGSALAVGRALVAVMENNQQADGSIVIPAVLRPYMHGLDVIRKAS